MTFMVLNRRITAEILRALAKFMPSAASKLHTFQKVPGMLSEPWTRQRYDHGLSVTMWPELFKMRKVLSNLSTLSGQMEPAAVSHRSGTSVSGPLQG